MNYTADCTLDPTAHAVIALKFIIISAIANHGHLLEAKISISLFLIHSN